MRKLEIPVSSLRLNELKMLALDPNFSGFVLLEDKNVEKRRFKIINSPSFLKATKRAGGLRGLFAMASGVIATRGSNYAIRDMDNPPNPEFPDDDVAVSIHELCHFYSVIWSRLLFQLSVQCYFIAKSIQDRIRRFIYFGDRDHFCLPLEVKVNPTDCVFNLFHVRGQNAIAVSLFDITEGLAAYYQIASSYRADRDTYAGMFEQMQTLSTNAYTRHYGVCYVLLAKRLCRYFGEEDGLYVSYHAFPIFCWLALQELRFVKNNVVNHPAENLEYFANIICLMNDIWEVLPTREEPSLEAVQYFATIFFSQLVAEQKLYIPHDPDEERLALESLHKELCRKLGSYCWEFNIPFFRGVFSEEVPDRVKQLSLLVGLAHSEGRSQLLKLIRPMSFDGIEPTRSLSIGVSYIKGKPFGEPEIAANLGSDAVFKDDKYWPRRLLYSGVYNRDIHFLGSRLWAPLQLHAIAGVFAVTLDKNIPPQLCAFSECQFHATALCHMWPFKPVDSINQCDFRTWFENFFGQNLLVFRNCGGCEKGIKISVEVNLWSVQGSS